MQDWRDPAVASVTWHYSQHPSFEVEPDPGVVLPAGTRRGRTMPRSSRRLPQRGSADCEANLLYQHHECASCAVCVRCCHSQAQPSGRLHYCWPQTAIAGSGMLGCRCHSNLQPPGNRPDAPSVCTHPLGTGCMWDWRPRRCRRQTSCLGHTLCNFARPTPADKLLHTGGWPQKWG